MKINLSLILFFSVFFSAVLCAQEIPLSEEQRIENLTELTETEFDDEQLLQQLHYYLEHPLNLNSANEEELKSLLILTDLQITNLIIYRKHNGLLIDVYELQAVPSWNNDLIKRLLPFITISQDVRLIESLRNRLSGGKHFLMARTAKVLQDQKGYNKELSNHYLGNDIALQLRYKYQYKNLLQFGLLADKDAGEPLFKGEQQSGFDFYSAHLFVRNIGCVKAFALGDFTVNLGQGLIHWQSLAFKKSSDALNIKRQAAILNPYSSAGEYYFNRGSGVTIQKGALEFTAFASYRKLSGNMVLDTLSQEEYSSSFQNSGYHRTTSEIADRNQIGQFSYGGNISFKSEHYKLGINAVRYNYSNPLFKRDDPYNAFAINGDEWSNYSLDYSTTYKNLHFFGEAAVDQKLNKAFINGVQISVDPKVDISLLYRNIAKEYQSVNGNAFTENILPSNENGFYTGVTVRPLVGWRIDAYADFYRFPWLKFRVDAPSKGRDYMLQLGWQPDKQFDIYIKYRNESKQINESSTSTETHYLVSKPKENIRFHLQYTVNPNLVFRTRTEFVMFDRSGVLPEQGFLTYIEARYKHSMKLSGNLRLQYFETDGYNSRIYAYESDVLYGYSIPAFFDKGNRVYLNINYDLSRNLSCWVRLAHTTYRNKTTIGSALDEIQGNKRSDIKLQIRYTF